MKKLHTIRLYILPITIAFFVLMGGVYGNREVYRPEEGDSELLSEIGKGVSVVENAGRGDVCFRGDFSDYKGTFSTTGGGFLKFDVVNKTIGAIYLANNSFVNFFSQNDGVIRTADAITGQGTFIKSGEGTLFLSDVRGMFDGDVIIEEGELLLGNEVGGYVFGQNGGGAIQVKEKARISLGGSAGLIFRQDFQMESGSRFSLNEALNSTIFGEMKLGQTQTSVSGEKKGVLFDLFASGSLRLSGGISGRDALLIFTDTNVSESGVGDSILVLDGDVKQPADRFTGVIRVVTNESREGSFIFQLNHKLAGSGAFFELSGYGRDKMSSLLIGVDEAVIAGLNGGTFTTVDGVSSMRTLIVRGGGFFAGTLGARLNLKKEGGETLVLSGKSSLYKGDFTVAEGALHLSNFGDVNGDVLLNEGGVFLYEGKGALKKMLIGEGGSLIKTGSDTMTMKNVKGEYKGDIFVNEGTFNVEGSGVVGNAFGVTVKGTIFIRREAVFGLQTGNGFLINKNMTIEEGGKIFLKSGNNSVIKGALEVKPGGGAGAESAGAVVDYDLLGGKALSLAGGLSGSGKLVLRAERRGLPGDRIFSLDGDVSDSSKRFSGIIQIETSGQAGNKGIMALVLNNERAAAGAIIDLRQGINTDAGIRPVLRVGVDKAIIAGLNGGAGALVEGVAVPGQEFPRLLVIQGGGSYLGSFGANLSLEKSGMEKLILEGSAVSFGGRMRLSAGTLQIGAAPAGASEKMSLDVDGGILELSEGAVIGDVNLRDGAFLWENNFVSAQSVAVSGGRMNFSANGSLKSLLISGGVVRISDAELSVDSMIVLSQTGILRLENGGKLKGSASLSLRGTQTAVDVETSDEERLFTHDLAGEGVFRVRNAKDSRTIYSGDSTAFTGQVEVVSGILRWENDLSRITTNVENQGLFEFSGSGEEMGNLTGTGRVHFSNSAPIVLNRAQLSAFHGTLLVADGSRIICSGRGNLLLGSEMVLEFTGGKGEFVLNGEGGKVVSSVRDIRLSSETVLSLTGNEVDFYLNGSSWYGEAADGRSLTLNAGNNAFYVTDASLSGNLSLLENIYLITLNEKGETVSGNVLIDDSGKLIVDVPRELDSTELTDEMFRYEINGDNSLTQGKVVRRVDTRVRSLTINAGLNNSELVLEGVALEIKSGNLSLKGDGDYAISAGSIGFDVVQESGEFRISQESQGTVTISSTMNETIPVLNKSGSGTLVLSGVLQNTGGIVVKEGSLILSGSTAGSGKSSLENHGTLILGAGKQENPYQVNYAALNALGKNSVTVFREHTSVDREFIVRNEGLIRMEMGGTQEFVHAFVGGGTTFIEKGAHFVLPEGADQSFSVSAGASLRFMLGRAVDSGLSMTGDGSIYLINNSADLLDLSGVSIGDSWAGFTGTLSMIDDERKEASSSIILNLGRMGAGAELIVSAGSRVNDTSTGKEIRDYQVTLGDSAVWQLARGASYMGALALGSTGMIQGIGDTLVNSSISGGVLHISGGNFTLNGLNTHESTVVGANTKIMGNSETAFGRRLDIHSVGAVAEIAQHIRLESLFIGEGGYLRLLSGSSLSVSEEMNFQGILSGSGTLNIDGISYLGGCVDETFALTSVNVLGGELTLSSDLGTSEIRVKTGARLNITGTPDLWDNRITMESGSRFSGGELFGGQMVLVGEEAMRESVKATGGIALDRLQVKDAWSRLEVDGNLMVTNGGAFFVNDGNSQESGAIVFSRGKMTLGGEFELRLDVNNSFHNNRDTLFFQLFQAEGGLSVIPDGLGKPSVFLKLDESLRDFFQLDQSSFASTGTVSITRAEMICYLLDSSDVTGEGAYVEGFSSPHAFSYLGAGEGNGESVFFFDRPYHIADGDDAYRLTNGKGWMNFHVEMTDAGSSAPRRLIIRDSESGEGGVLLSVRGNAHTAYTGGTRIYQSRVEVDGTQTGEPAPRGVEEGRVYFFGTGQVELTGEKSAILFNTGGTGSTGAYEFHNDFLLQQGALLEQVSSHHIMSGNIRIRETALLRNLTDQVFTFSGESISGDELRIEGAGIDGRLNKFEFGVSHDRAVKINLETADVSKKAHVILGNQAEALIGCINLDAGSRVSVLPGGILSVREFQAGVHGYGTLHLAGGTFRLVSDSRMMSDQTRLELTGTEGARSRLDLAGHRLDLGVDISSWECFEVSGGGTLSLLSSLSELSQANGLITGKGTVLSVGTGHTFAGNFTIEQGALLHTQENVILKGILNIGSGGRVDFSKNTRWEGGALNMNEGSVYSGFLKGEGAVVRFSSGSHFLVGMEELCQLTESSGEALLVASQVTIEKGTGFFLFGGDDGIINDALLDPDQEKTLIIGREGISVGLEGKELCSLRELDEAQLAAMIAETEYQWLTFTLHAAGSGENGAKLNVSVKRNVNFSELARTTNEQAIAPVLSYLGKEGGQADSRLFGEEIKELGLSLAKAKGNGYEMLQTAALSTSSILSGYTVQRENLRRHVLELRDRAVQEQPCYVRTQTEAWENTLWASALGGAYTIDGDGNAVGHSVSTWGGQLGMSRCLNEKTAVGLAFSHTSSDVTLDQGMGSSVSKSFYVDMYVKYHKDHWNVTGLLTGGIADLDTTRNMSWEGFSSRTSGATSGTQWMGMLEVGYEFEVEANRSNIIEPLVLLVAGQSSLDGFEESGAGSAGLCVEEQRKSSCSVGAGVRYVKEFKSAKVGKGRFEVRVVVMQEMTDNEVDVEVHFQGAPEYGFSQKSGKRSKTGILLGSGVVFPLRGSLSLFADLNGEFCSTETGGSAHLGIKYGF